MRAEVRANISANKIFTPIAYITSGFLKHGMINPSNCFQPCDQKKEKKDKEKYLK